MGHHQQQFNPGQAPSREYMREKMAPMFQCNGIVGDKQEEMLDLMQKDKGEYFNTCMQKWNEYLAMQQQQQVMMQQMMASNPAMYQQMQAQQQQANQQYYNPQQMRYGQMYGGQPPQH